MSAQNALFQSKKMTSPMQPNFNMEPRNRHIPISRKMEIKSRGYSKPTSFQIFFPTNFPTIQPEIIFNSFKPHFLEFHGTFQLQVCACPAASNATQAAQHQAGAAAIACPAAARPVLPGPRW